MDGSPDGWMCALVNGGRFVASLSPCVYPDLIDAATRVHLLFVFRPPASIGAYSRGLYVSSGCGADSVVAPPWG